MLRTILANMKTKIIITGDEYRNSKYSTPEWEKSVEISYWEHNYEEDTYTIVYNERQE